MDEFILYPLIGPVIIFLILLLVLWPCCMGRIRACNATSLPPDEAEQIINSMQGDWNVTLTPGSCMCGCTSFERMTVTGNVMARLNSGNGNNRPISLQPKKTGDGTLILDSYGSKAIVFTPEQGKMETELMGWNLKWSKVGFQENLEQGQPLVHQPQVVVGPSTQGGVAEEIQRLHQLKLQGALTEEEFSAAKFRMLNPGQSSGGPSVPYDQPPPYSADLEAGLPMKNY